MTDTTASRNPHVHAVVYRQDQIDKRRGFLRDTLLRRIGFGLAAHVTAIDAEFVPAEGPALLVMNHIGALDPFVVVGAVQHRFVVPMSKIENTRNPVVGLIVRAWGAYPVRRGEVDRQALASTLALLQQGRVVLLAPEGTRHATLHEAKHGMAYLATKANVPLVPVGVDGTDQFPRSLLHLRRAQVTLRFGRPFRFETGGSGRVERDALHAMTQEAMYRLAALLPEERRGAYADLARATTHTLEFVD